MPSVLLWRVVQSCGQTLQLPQSLRMSLVLVSHQFLIEYQRKRYEEYTGRDNDNGGGYGRVDADSVELDPAKDGNLSEEQQNAETSGANPRDLDTHAHRLVRRFVDGCQVVHVAHGLDVGHDARADHQGHQVHGDEEGGAHAEHDQQRVGDGGLTLGLVDLNLHHGNLKQATHVG